MGVTGNQIKQGKTALTEAAASGNTSSGGQGIGNLLEKFESKSPGGPGQGGLSGMPQTKSISELKNKLISSAGEQAPAPPPAAPEEQTPAQPAAPEPAGGTDATQAPAGGTDATQAPAGG